MHWLAPMIILLGLCGLAQAREPLARPMERTPSIMVGGEEAQPSKTIKRRQVKRPPASRARATRGSRTSTSVPRASAVYEAQTRSVNRSINRQQQELQLEQRRQIENNLFRQEIQRSINSPIGGVGKRSPGCSPGLIGC